jgi:hypothetical protein
MNIRHSGNRGGSASATAADVAITTSRHKTLFLILIIAIYASLGLFMEEPSEHHSRLLSGESTDNVSSEKRQQDAIPMHRGLSRVKPFSIHDALKTKSIYKSQFGLAVYSQNAVTLYYPTKNQWKAGCHKLIRAFEALSTTLRALNVTSSGEIVLPISAGDSPRIDMTECVTSDNFPCFENSSPVLQFGSGFANPVIPGEIVLPMPQNDHIGCFLEFSRTGKLCMQNAKRKYYDIEWEDLLPQIVWRGTDFSYLGHFRRLRAPEFERDVDRIDSSSALDSMKQVYNELVPRWKGVVLTAEAENEASAKNHETLPWANIKFSHFMSEGKKTPTSEGSFYVNFQSNGIPAIGEYISLENLSQYKYHIDLGGGGGTTWSGTLDKLALPGLLFHHVTPMKDYFHDALKPWEHYIPVNEDLSDLKEKFDWAEANQEEAKTIAKRSTEWVKQWFGTEKGFEAIFDMLYKEPLQTMLNSYQHVDEWESVLENADVKPIMRCTGEYEDECEQLDKSLHYYANGV